MSLVSVSYNYFFHILSKTILINYHGIELSPAPVDVQISCNLILWRNAPNISHEDIVGYNIKLINLAINKEVIIDLNASATFYNLDELEDETLKHESTFIQVIT